MYRHVLIAIDGSEYSLRAAAHGLALAKSMSAKASVITVMPTWRAVGLSEVAVGHFEEEYQGRARAEGEQRLAKVAALAAEAGVPCESVQVTHEHPYQAIIYEAGTRGCDLIVVGSHGRRGVAGLLLGSEATKVLTHSNIPVLVYRE